jgi:Dolichyl-phosphate-mannose-protein mannosyltransferase
MRKLFWVFIIIFTVITGFYFFLGWNELPAGHRYIYPLDDVYIHLALARNFAEHGVWSINTSGFDSASSSILYTLMLAFFIKVFGDWEYYPLIINMTFGFLTIYAVYRYFKDFYGKNELIWVMALLLPFSLLYMMSIIGMEHTLHMFLMVLAIYFIRKNLDSHFKRKDFGILLAVVFFISIVRFESMFFTTALAFSLFVRRNFMQAFAVLLTGFLPILIFGLISVREGGFFFPNSVMIKGSYPEGSHFIYTVWQIFKDGILFNTSFYKCLFAPLVILFVVLLRKYKKQNVKSFFKNETLIITVVSTCLMHSLFAFMKYRYENYLMISILLIIIPYIADFFRSTGTGKFRFTHYNLGMAFGIFILFMVSIYRFGYHHNPLRYASKGINEQQIEMSRFLGQYYKGDKVIANDIGAIAYFSHVRLLDMVGLGSTEVAKLKVENKHKSREEYIVNNRTFIKDYAVKHKYKIAVIYYEWFPGYPPKNWIPVASWTIPGKYGPAIQRVVFYAVDPAEKENLRKKLAAFDLNPNVQQWFYYYR